MLTGMFWTTPDRNMRVPGLRNDPVMTQIDPEKPSPFFLNGSSYTSIWRSEHGHFSFAKKRWKNRAMWKNFSTMFYFRNQSPRTNQLAMWSQTLGSKTISGPAQVAMMGTPWVPIIAIRWSERMNKRLCNQYTHNKKSCIFRIRRFSSDK